MVWKAKAPSNIALIKYMGKRKEGKNQATNSSLSMTLDSLLTYVEIEEDNMNDRWEPLVAENLYPLDLSENGKNRYLQHWSFLKSYFQIEGNYKIRSANNFPSDCGLASSASSFAALTLCAYEVAKVRSSCSKELHLMELAQLSQKGSGSSCRSFFSPWCIWNETQGVFPLNFPEKCLHQVIIVESKKKEVSSSEAHQRVLESALFAGRVERAQARSAQLEKLLMSDWKQNWKLIFELVWAEFWDMHSLFETSSPPFGYMTDKSLFVLNWIRNFWSENGDGPIVTMDAGANVHFLFRQDQIEIYQKIKNIFLNLNFKVIV